MARIIVLVAAAAIAGGIGANLLLGREAPATRNLAFSVDPAIVADALRTIPTPAPETPCPSCGQDEQAWRSKTSVPPPELLGQSAALLEASCGRQIFGLRSHERRPAASLTKIATALVAVDQNRWNDVIDVGINGWDLSAEDDSSIMGLEAGMRITVEELVWGLLLRSGNDAALELARVLGGQERFVEMMNAKARSLGLTDTQFKNPDGRDADGAYSTTFDMAVLGRALLANPTLAHMVQTRDHVANWSGEVMPNGNWLLYVYPEAIGIKTGYTEAAGGTIVAAAQREGRILIASVFDSADIFWDSMRLFRWAFDNVPASC